MIKFVFTFLKTCIMLNPVMYFTPSGKRYHNHSCETLSHTRAEDWLCARLSDAEALGERTPCNVCEPATWLDVLLKK